MKPFEKGSRPWKRTEFYNADGHPLYETTAVIDFVLESGSVVRVPQGFLWDGASIPKSVQWLIGKPMGRYALSALLHDWLYASRILGDTKAGRRAADKIFNRTLAQQNISSWRRIAMYRAVRLGGSYAYHKTDETMSCIKLMDLHQEFNPFADYQVHL